MDAARASGTDLASSLRQNMFLIEKSDFEVHDTFPQGRFCGVKIAFLKAKWRFSRRGVFVKPKTRF